MVRKLPIHWALISNGGEARVYRLRRHPPEFELVGEATSPTRRQNRRDLESDASGRAYNVSGPGSHAKQGRVDARDAEEERFIDHVVGRLERAAARGDFDRLVVFADARSLGRLRKAWNGNLASRVIAEDARDLTPQPADAVEKAVRKALDWPV